MTRLLICDDDPNDLDHVEALVTEYYEGGAEINAFTAPEKALEYMQGSDGADIVLLDILMPGMTGTELALMLRNTGFYGHIVFLTSSNDFAAESYAAGALSYLLKPVKREALHAVLDKATASPVKDTASFAIRQGKLKRQILFQSFIYAEVIGHTLHFHLLGGEVAQAYASLSEYESMLLREPRCARCHKSFIVNMDYVERVEGKTLTMRTGREISITRSFAEFGEKYFKWIFKETEAGI